jgi:hypothetical protein
MQDLGLLGSLPKEGEYATTQLHTPEDLKLHHSALRKV